jgi:hypothetical protein
LWGTEQIDKDMTRKRNRADRIKTGVLFLATLVICIIGSESVSRRVEAVRTERMRAAESAFFEWALQQPESPPGEEVYAPAPNGGMRYRYQPNLRWTQTVESEFVYWYTNPLGMRWRETETTKAPGVTRVAFVGDSITLGGYTRDHTTSYVGVVESLFDRQRVDVLNFGVGGYGIHEVHEQVVQEVSEFNPDVIVLGLFNGNDFRDTFLGFDTRVTPEGGLTRITTLSADAAGESEPPDLHEGSNYLWVRETLSRGVRLGTIYRFLKENPDGYGNLGALEPAQPNRRAAAFEETKRMPSEHLDFKALNRFTGYTYWSLRDISPIAEQAIEETLGYLDRIQRFCDSRGIKFVVVAIPFREQVTTSHPVNDVYDVRLPQSYVEEWARERGTPYLDLLPLFRNLEANTRNDVYVGDGHWNSRGHLIGGTAIAEFLRPLLGNTGTAAGSGRALTSRLLDISATARLATIAYGRVASRWRP